MRLNHLSKLGLGLIVLNEIRGLFVVFAILSASINQGGALPRDLADIQVQVSCMVAQACPTRPATN